jgi:hypothetical protein
MNELNGIRSGCQVQGHSGPTRPHLPTSLDVYAAIANSLNATALRCSRKSRINKADNMRHIQPTDNILLLV